MKKAYEAPEADFTSMKNVAIITSSGPVDLGGENIDDFGDDDTEPTPTTEIRIIIE